MIQKNYVDVTEVVNAFGISKGKAYEIIRLLNSELKEKGYLTVSGRCPRKFFEEKFYGYNQHQDEISKANENNTSTQV